MEADAGQVGLCQQSGPLVGIFPIDRELVLIRTTDPAWTSGIARGTGAGTSELESYKGLLVNKNTITLLGRPIQKAPSSFWSVTWKAVFTSSSVRDQDRSSR